MTAALRFARAFVLDAAIMALSVLAFVSLVRGGAAWGLIAASLAVTVWLAASIVEQLRVLPGRARLLNAHGQEIEVEGSPRGARVAHWPGAKVEARGRRDRFPSSLPRLSGRVPLGERDDFAQDPASGWRAR